MYTVEMILLAGVHFQQVIFLQVTRTKTNGCPVPWLSVKQKVMILYPTEYYF